MLTGRLKPTVSDHDVAGPIDETCVADQSRDGAEHETPARRGSGQLKKERDECNPSGKRDAEIGKGDKKERARNSPGNGEFHATE